MDKLIGRTENFQHAREYFGEATTQGIIGGLAIGTGIGLDQLTNVPEALNIIVLGAGGAFALTAIHNYWKGWQYRREGNRWR